jgi:RHS repeat-associated protein
MDELAGQQNSLMGAYNMGSAGTVYLFLPTYFANSWGRTGSGRYAWVSRSAGDIVVDEMNSAQWPCDGTGIPGQQGGVFCDRILDGAFPTSFSSWMVQSTDALKLVDGINNARTEHHHTFGIYRRVANTTFVDSRTALSTQSVTNSSGDRQSTVASQVALLGLLEGVSGAQQNDSWGNMSSHGLFALANEKALATAPPSRTHRFYNVTTSNVTQVLNALTTYDAVDKAFVRSYLDSSNPGYSAILSRDGSIGSYTWGDWTTQLLTTPIFAFSSDATRLAYVSTGRNKGAGTGSAAYDSAMASVGLADPKKKLELKYSVDTSSGHFSYEAPPDIETGQGGFPYSLPFVRSISSTNRDRWEVYWIQNPLYGIMIPIDDPSHTLANGWRHNYEIWARIANDGFQALGSDSGLDASAAVTALYAMRALNVGTQTFQTRVTSIFVMDWLGKQMMDNAVVVDIPPASSTYVRLPSGLYNPPPGSSEIMERTGSRTRAIAGVTNFDYNNITLKLTDSTGGVISFSNSDYDANTTYQNDVLIKNKFKADSWVFPEGVRVDFNYPPAVLLTPGNESTLRYRRYLGSVSNNLGRSLTFNGQAGGLSDLTVTDENGRTATVRGYAAGATDSSGMSVSYGYEGYAGYGTPTTGMLSSITLPSGSRVLSVRYDSLQRVQSVDDASDNRTTFYSAKVSAERLARSETRNALGENTSTVFDRGGRPIQQVDPVGRFTTNVYDGIGRLTRTILPEQNSADYTYDVRGNTVTRTARAKSGSGGLTTTSTYFTSPTTWRCPASELKRCNKVVTIDGPRTDVVDSTAITYSQGTGQELTRIGPAVTGGSPQTTMGYQAYAGLTAPGGGATSISLLTSLTQKMDASRDTITAFGYETLANKLVPKSVTVDSGGFNLQAQIGFDPVGNIQTVTDPRGKISRYCFDGGRRMTRETKQMGTLDAGDCTATPAPTGDDIVSIQEFDSDGLVFRVRRKDGDAGIWRNTTYSRTPTKSLETETDAEGNVTRYDYDVAGRVSMVTDPAGRKTRTFYFADGKIRKEIHGYQFSATSTDESCSVAGTDQTCYVQLAYAPAGGLPENYNGNLRRTTDANGNVTAYSFDDYDRADRTTFADSTYEQNLLYDAAGNVRQKRNRAGDIVVSEYDALNRITSKSHASFPTVSFGYDLMSHQTSANQTGGQSVSWLFDKAGRVESTTAGTRTVGYLYDNSSNRRRVTWPDGFFVEYTYDDANRMDLVKENDSQVLADYTWDTLSRPKSILRGNGDVSNFYYEDDSDLRQLAHPGLPTAPVFDITRNAAHQIRTFASTDPALFWTPPVNGTTSYTPNNLNQYSLVGTVNPGYDPNGNLTSDGSTTYTYDAENHLLTASLAGVTTTYKYDGGGRRISKKVGAEPTAPTTEFLMDGNEEIAEYVNNLLVRRYVSGATIDERIVMYEGTGSAAGDERYYYTNHQGSTVAVADGNGSVIETFKYSPYGESSTVTGNPFRFTGRRYDPESGLYFFRARYYSPKLGRFLQTDPLGTQDDYNLYVFLGNDPLNHTDPSGLCKVDPATGEIIDCNVKIRVKDANGNIVEKDWKDATPAERAAAQKMYDKTVKMGKIAEKNVGSEAAEAWEQTADIAFAPFETEVTTAPDGTQRVVLARNYFSARSNGSFASSIIFFEGAINMADGDMQEFIAMHEFFHGTRTVGAIGMAALSLPPNTAARTQAEWNADVAADEEAIKFLRANGSHMGFCGMTYMIGCY